MLAWSPITTHYPFMSIFVIDAKIIIKCPTHNLSVHEINKCLRYEAIGRHATMKQQIITVITKELSAVRKPPIQQVENVLTLRLLKINNIRREGEEEINYLLAIPFTFDRERN